MKLDRKYTKNKCPDTEIFIKAFLKELSLEEKEKLIDHILTCGKCRMKFEAMRKLSNELSKFKEDFEGENFSDSEEKEFRKMATKRIRELRREEKRKFFHLIPARYIIAAAGLLIVIVGYFLVSKFQQNEVYREGEKGGLRLIEPVGKISKPPTVFIWTAPERVDNYTFELIDDELNVVHLALAYEGKVTLPENVRKKLYRGKIYIWKIEAFDVFYRKLGSNQKHFEIE